MSSNWYDIIMASEEAQKTRLLRMTPEEWRAESKRIIRSWRGDVRHCLAYLNRIEAQRAAYVAIDAQPASVCAPLRTEFDVDFGLWRDMVEEPEKYGDDIIDWLELNDKLMAGAGRWRLGAYWATHQEPLRARMAVVIQAAIRGHQERARQPFRNCCMCLSHRISPLQTDVGMMCRGCAAQGPYEDETGPVADPWAEFRADYVDVAEIIEFPPCKWCFAPLDEGQDHFCDEDCKHSYVKESCRLMRS